MLRKKTLLTILKIAISLGLLLFLFSGLNLRNLGTKLVTLNLFYIAISFILLLISIIVSAYRWQLLLVPQKAKVPLVKLTSLYFVGLFFNNFLPTSIGGDVIKTYKLAKICPKAVDAVVSVFMDRFMGLVALVTISLVSLFLSFRLVDNNTVTTIVLTSFFLTVGSVVAYRMEWLEKILLLLKRLGFNLVENRVKQMIESLNAYKDSSMIILNSLLLSFLFQIIVIIQAILIAKAIGLNVPAIYFYLFIPLIMLISVAPVSINGLGIREGAFVMFFSPIGVSNADSIILSLLIYLSLLLASLIGGIVYAIDN